MKRVLISGSTLVILIALTAVAAHAQTDETTTLAKKYFDSGKILYKQASYKEAIVEFQKAYSLVPHGALLYNIAQCYEKLGDVPQALRSYKEYLRAVPNAEDKDYVQVSINNQEKRLREKGVQQVRVYSNPPGAQVAINGELKGSTPFSIEVTPGKYFLTLTKKGFRPVEKDFQMTGDTSLELDFALNEVKLNEPIPAPAPAPRPEEKAVVKPAETAATAREATSEGGGRVWTWVLGGTGLAAVGTGVAMGVLARGAADDLHNNVHSINDKTTPQDLADTAQQDALIANIMFGVGGALIAGSVVLFFVEGKANKTALLESPLPSLGISTNPRTGGWFVTLGSDFLPHRALKFLDY